MATQCKYWVATINNWEPEDEIALKELKTTYVVCGYVHINSPAMYITSVKSPKILFPVREEWMQIKRRLDVVIHLPMDLE